MGMSVRVFLVDENEKLVRFPYARFNRLWGYDRGESLPECSAGVARFAVAYVELVERQVERLLHVDYMRVQLDDRGCFDQQAIERCLRLAASSLDSSPLAPAGEKGGNVIRAEHRFHRARYQGEFSWEPTMTQREELHCLALM